MWKSDAPGSEGFSCNLTTVLQSRFLKPEYWFSAAAGIFLEKQRPQELYCAFIF